MIARGALPEMARLVFKPALPCRSLVDSGPVLDSPPSGTRRCRMTRRTAMAPAPRSAKMDSFEVGKRAGRERLRKTAPSRPNLAERIEGPGGTVLRKAQAGRQGSSVTLGVRDRVKRRTLRFDDAIATVRRLGTQKIPPSSMRAEQQSQERCAAGQFGTTPLSPTLMRLVSSVPSGFLVAALMLMAAPGLSALASLT
jgi:hypothetical protein